MLETLLTLVALVLLLALVVAGFLAVHHWLAERRPWASLTARRVVVNLKSGDAVDGFLIARQGPLLRLRDAVLVSGGDNPTPVDGEVVIERSEVDFLQYPNT